MPDWRGAGYTDHGVLEGALRPVCLDQDQSRSRDGISVGVSYPAGGGLADRCKESEVNPGKFQPIFMVVELIW